MGFIVPPGCSSFVRAAVAEAGRARKSVPIGTLSSVIIPRIIEFWFNLGGFF
jgi:hypothetical protein